MYNALAPGQACSRAHNKNDSSKNISIMKINPPENNRMLCACVHFSGMGAI